MQGPGEVARDSSIDGRIGILGRRPRVGSPIMSLTELAVRAAKSAPKPYKVYDERGWNPDLIELQLAHKERNKVRAAYNRAQVA